MDEASFSGIVKIANISDYIVPSKACIIPLQSTRNETEVRIHQKNDVKSQEKLSKVQVKLSDCLACSGCITSAETVLLKEQSESMFKDGLARSRIAVVTVSPQAVVSMAFHKKIRASDAAQQFARCFRTLGVEYVLDSSFARLLTLELSYDEFKQYKSKKPLFSCACPGFVCYAEKTHGNLVLPHTSRVRSPQAMMGALVKDYLARVLRVKPEDIFHAAVMPCYDKKLEAAREDSNVVYRGVDCVLTTAEAVKILDEIEESDISSNSLESTPGNSLSWLNALENGHFMSTEGGPSGGYAEYMIKRSVQDCVEKVSVNKIEKNSNLIELQVVRDGGCQPPLVTVAKCYGFRNIQNVIQRLKRNTCAYDYVEIMACPSGCTNGAGQISAQTRDARKQLVTQMDAMLLTGDHWTAMLNEMEHVKSVWNTLNPDWGKLMYNEYKPVVGTIDSIVTDW